MKQYNRILTLMIAAALSLCSLTGCGAGVGRTDTAAGETMVSQAETASSGAASSVPEEDSAAEQRYSVVCTIFPAYDWMRQILGERTEQVDLTLLLDNGVDLHNYQPTAEDIVTIGSCDLFVYVGGESDEWVEDALKEATNPKMKVVNLLESIGDQAKEEELVEGMEGEEEEAGEEEEGPEYDEHVWLSLRNARTLTQILTDAMKEIDSANAEGYQSNCDRYTAQLSRLDEEYQAAVEGASVKTLLFGDRFPFRYLVDDYGLKYYAAFVGCSAETEASFETVVFLAGKVDELGLKTICTIENSDQRIAQTIIDNTAEKNQSILTMDSLQSTTMQDINAGATYLSAMEQNLETLKQALQ